ncbi:MAG: hypothetical protein J6X70_04580 [Muribaculaceae bacterium]|nr:hypothetical protein [Muribaculaceae bacterium]
MRLLSFIVFMALLGGVGTAAQQPVASSQTVCCGTLESYPSFPSRYITPRDVTVWLPDGYEKGDPCDVLYMHDGQMLFDAAATWNHQEWQVDEVMCRLQGERGLRPCIVVGIDNTQARIFEYFPKKMLDYLTAEQRGAIGEYEAMLTADNYLRFLVEELKPFIDSEYQPLTGPRHTLLMGSSMGGLISLYAMCEYPEVFGGAACLSTHLSMKMTDDFDNEPWAEAFRKYVKEHNPSPRNHRLYMDRGTVELDGSYAPYQDAMDELLRSMGWEAPHFVSRVFDGHQHNEQCWASRLDVPLRFLLSIIQ